MFSNPFVITWSLQNNVQFKDADGEANAGTILEIHDRSVYVVGR